MGIIAKMDGTGDGSGIDTSALNEVTLTDPDIESVM
jgi:hypothetical protein